MSKVIYKNLKAAIDKKIADTYSMQKTAFYQADQIRNEIQLSVAESFADFLLISAEYLTEESTDAEYRVALIAFAKDIQKKIMNREPSSNPDIIGRAIDDYRGLVWTRMYQDLGLAVILA